MWRQGDSLLLVVLSALLLLRLKLLPLLPLWQFVPRAAAAATAAARLLFTTAAAAAAAAGVQLSRGDPGGRTAARDSGRPLPRGRGGASLQGSSSRCSKDSSSSSSQEAQAPPAFCQECSCGLTWKAVGSSTHQEALGGDRSDLLIHGQKSRDSGNPWRRLWQRRDGDATNIARISSYNRK